MFRPDHTYNRALRGPLVGPESLGVGVQTSALEINQASSIAQGIGLGL
jgi:hypothetical protein